jgi:hypothetical protein
MALVSELWLPGICVVWGRREGGPDGKPGFYTHHDKKEPPVKFMLGKPASL